MNCFVLNQENERENKTADGTPVSFSVRCKNPFITLNVALYFNEENLSTLSLTLSVHGRVNKHLFASEQMLRRA